MSQIKISLSVLTVILSIHLGSAQFLGKGITLEYQKVDIGNGLQINYFHPLGNGKWWITPGLYVHFNALPADDQSYGFRNRGWATEWYQHLGIGLSINRALLSHKSTRVYAFYNAHVFHIKYINKVYQLIVDPNTGQNYYTLYEGISPNPPVWSWETSIGLGLQTMLTERIGFNIRGGMGVAMYYDPYTITYQPHDLLGTDDWGSQYMFSLGFSYYFKN